MDPRIERIANAVEFLKGRIGGMEPETGIVLGSGLGKLADRISDPVVVPYREIPGFPFPILPEHSVNYVETFLLEIAKRLN